MASIHIRIAALMLAIAVVFSLPSFILQSGHVAAQLVPTPSATVESGANGDAGLAELPANPFPEASWHDQDVQAVLDALARGANLQSAQSAPAALINDAQLQAAPAAGSRILLPYVFRGAAPVPPTATPTATRTPKPDDGDHEPSADVAVGIWPNPSVLVVRGGSIAYELRASNFGRGKANNVQVKLPYKKSQMEIYGTTIPGSGDWVSEITDTQVTFTFGTIHGGEQRKATLFFRLKSAVSTGTVIPMQALYTWSDHVAATNAAPVKVATYDEGSAWATMSVAPATVKANVTQRFATDRYGPGEGVTFWLNLPDGGVRALNETAVADAQGRMTIDIRFRDLPPGNYSLVGQGQRSSVIGVGFFTVKP